ncbi:MAG TPA: DUF2934 domain-containing protein [Verrucomicrobiae bacterium]|nr:DUF2934 domain-containing protein [Verrucomicrobiae bacterium]
MARELPKPNAMKPNTPTQEEISARAYQIFVERGCPEGRDLEHWLEAEAQLNASTQMQTQAPAATTASIGTSPDSRTATRQTQGRKAQKTATSARI